MVQLEYKSLNYNKQRFRLEKHTFRLTIKQIFLLQNEKPMDIEMMPSSVGTEQEEQPTFDSSRGFDNPLYDSPPLNVGN